MSKSGRYLLTIPPDLMTKVDQVRGEASVQDFTLAALRDAVYGSPVKARLRAENERLLGIIERALAGAVQLAPAAPEPPPVRYPNPTDSRAGW